MTSSEENKLDFTNALFQSETCTYDGKSHILPEVSGVPEGTTIKYNGRNEYVDAGSYQATAFLSKEGYNDKTLFATLTINQATLIGYTFESKTVTYDGKEHINDVQLVGFLPDGTSVDTVVKNSKDMVVTSAIEVGSYAYTCTITNKNYIKVTLNATLTIEAKKNNMPVFVSNDGIIYFSNGLHDSYLYSYIDTSENQKWKLIDYSRPKEFEKEYGFSSTIFIANSLWEDSVKEVKEGTTSLLYTDANIDDFVRLNDNIYYYSNNSSFLSNAGIYKVDVTNQNDEPIVTKIFEGKSDNLSINNGYLYFTNKNNNYLYRIDLSTNVPSLVMEEKVHEFIINENKLYCAVNGLVNDYIGYLDLTSSSTKPNKLTNAAGEFLTIKNGYLYYNYSDLFSYIEPSYKGIWRISLSGGEPNQILANNGVNGFDVDSSNSLIYIDSTDLHLYRYTISTKNKTDLLSGFVAPELAPMNTGGRNISLGNKIYYLNMYAGKTLYVYDEIEKKSYQLTTNKVEDIYIYNGILYFNQVTNLVNNDLYSIDLSISSEPVKISTNDVRNLTSDGTYLYATHYNWAGVSGGISRMKLDGTEYQKFSEVNGAKNLIIKDSKLYYINCATGPE